MKTVQILFVSLFCFLTISLSAQFSVGLKAGYVDAWANYGNYSKKATSNVNGFQVSGLIYYQFNNWLKIGIEPGVVRRGYFYDPVLCFDFCEASRSIMNYIELPVMVQFNVEKEDKPVFLFGKLGFGASRMISGYRVYKSGSSTHEMTDKKYDYNYSLFDFYAFDFGSYAGAGMGVKFLKSRLFVETRYYHSLKLTNANWKQFSKTRSLEYSLGYLHQF